MRAPGQWTDAELAWFDEQESSWPEPTERQVAAVRRFMRRDADQQIAAA